MAEEKYGIEALKGVISFAMDIKKDVEKAKEDDGKVKGAAEFIQIAMNGLKLPKLIASGKDIKNEYLDLSDAERAELNSWFAAEFDIANDKVEGYIERAFGLALAITDLIDYAI